MEAPQYEVDLFKGWPATKLLPIDYLKTAVAKKLSDKTILDGAFGYGPNEGHFPLRENISKWLTGHYSPPVPIQTDQICITGGASQNLASILQAYSDPVYTEAIWLVEPCYHLVFRVFEDAGFYSRLKPVPEDEGGMDIEALERSLEASRLANDESNVAQQKSTKSSRPSRKTYRHIIYCIPSFSNPSGNTMSRSRREALIRVARRYDALVICDDVYDFLCWPTEPTNNPASNAPLRLVDIEQTLDNGPIDRFGNVVSNGSFSKLIGPGCRIGWAQATDSFIFGLSETGQTRSGGAPSHLMSTFIDDFLETGFLQQYIETILIRECSRRYSVMVSAIRKYLDCVDISFSPDPDHNTTVGGYYIWLKLPSPLLSEQVCARAMETQNLVLGCSSLFVVPGNCSPMEDVSRRVRLCFMWEDEDKLVEGIKRLGAVLDELINETQ
ncbi:Pyridoxal phosphate-dependent transferase major region subdomain 1 [Penicillium angulare]|uniref:Pyridoxal phosphate-dependent transferase major region subdomain 1 n=1 Tax=Penicillium angulare TaxID=116970 RepID=A0A9W9K570_9EURO|nr:Pyridoxal phosphate-dependent transferase major region subdomain 1 [Penicillium angulare]